MLEENKETSLYIYPLDKKGLTDEQILACLDDEFLDESLLELDIEKAMLISEGKETDPEAIDDILSILEEDAPVLYQDLLEEENKTLLKDMSNLLNIIKCVSYMRSTNDLAELYSCYFVFQDICTRQKLRCEENYELNEAEKLFQDRKEIKRHYKKLNHFMKIVED